MAEATPLFPPANGADDLERERNQEPEDIERDGVLLGIDGRGLTIMCQCTTEIVTTVEIDTHAPDYHPNALPVREVECPTCTARIRAFGPAWAEKRCIIPLHIAVGQHHVDLVDDDDDDAPPAPPAA